MKYLYLCICVISVNCGIPNLLSESVKNIEEENLDKSNNVVLKDEVTTVSADRQSEEKPYINTQKVHYVIYKACVKLNYNEGKPKRVLHNSKKKSLFNIPNCPTGFERADDNTCQRVET